MSRSALTVSLALHAAVLAVVGWSSASLLGSAALGKTEIGVAFSPEDAGGLVADDTPPAPPARAEITPPTFTPNLTPPSPAIETERIPVTSFDPVPPPISTVATLPAEFPSIAQPQRPRATTQSAAKSSSSKSRTMAATTGLNGGGAAGVAAGRGGGGGPGYTPPQFLIRYKPPYPEEARAQRIEGVVMLLVSLDASGRVLSAQLSQSSGHDVLDRAALAAIRSWRFVPAHQADQAVPATVEVPIRFHFSA